MQQDHCIEQRVKQQNAANAAKNPHSPLACYHFRNRAAHLTQNEVQVRRCKAAQTAPAAQVQAVYIVKVASSAQKSASSVYGTVTNIVHGTDGAYSRTYTHPLPSCTNCTFPPCFNCPNPQACHSLALHHHILGCWLHGVTDGSTPLARLEAAARLHTAHTSVHKQLLAAGVWCSDVRLRQRKLNSNIYQRSMHCTAGSCTRAPYALRTAYTPSNCLLMCKAPARYVTTNHPPACRFPGLSEQQFKQRFDQIRHALRSSWERPSAPRCIKGRSPYLSVTHLPRMPYESLDSSR